MTAPRVICVGRTAPHGRSHSKLSHSQQQHWWPYRPREQGGLSAQTEMPLHRTGLSLYFRDVTYRSIHRIKPRRRKGTGGKPPDPRISFQNPRVSETSICSSRVESPCPVPFTRLRIFVIKRTKRGSARGQTRTCAKDVPARLQPYQNIRFSWTIGPSQTFSSLF